LKIGNLLHRPGGHEHGRPGAQASPSDLAIEIPTQQLRLAAASKLMEIAVSFEKRFLHA
jgi:hypothetical protein